MKKIRKILALLLMATVMAACSTKSVTTAAADTGYWAADTAWYESKGGWDEKKIDVFYISSTEVLAAYDAQGNEKPLANMDAKDRAALEGEIAWVEKNMFYDDFNVISPYYHQFTFNAIALPPDSMSTLYKAVAKEVCEAFDHYMATKNNGRHFILAGFSQGAFITLDVIRHMTDEQYSRMITAYSIGGGISKEMMQHERIKPAVGETEKGTIVSFNSVLTPEALWHFVHRDAATCINPINWRTDTMAAVFYDHNIRNSVHVDTATQQLIVDSEHPEHYEKEMQRLSFFGERGVSDKNLHHWDLLFFGKNIHDNALKRSTKR